MTLERFQRLAHYQRNSLICGFVFIALLQFIWPQPVMAADEEVEVAKAFVDKLTDQCSYGDGYVCQPIAPSEQNFLSPEGMAAMVSGNRFKAWQVAYSDMLTDPEFDKNQRDLKHYQIGIAEDEDFYIVLFSALLLPRVIDGKMVGLLSVGYGRSVKYWIRKQDMVLVSKKFLK